MTRSFKCGGGADDLFSPSLEWEASTIEGNFESFLIRRSHGSGREFLMSEKLREKFVSDNVFLKLSSCRAAMMENLKILN